MKYFTPDLLGRFGSPDDAIALAAQEELEARAEQYTQHLKEVQAKLPNRLLEMQGRYYLHDARVISHWLPMPLDCPGELPWLEWLRASHLERAGDRWSSLLLALQLDTPPKELLILHYRSVLVEEVSYHRPFQEGRLPYLEWQHDEVDVVTENGVTYTLHSILLSNGIELRLQFRDFDFATMKPLAPSPEPNGHPHRRK